MPVCSVTLLRSRKNKKKKLWAARLYNTDRKTKKIRNICLFTLNSCTGGGGWWFPRTGSNGNGGSWTAWDQATPSAFGFWSEREL